MGDRHPKFHETRDNLADPIRCGVVKQRSSIAKRRAAVFNRLDAQLELLGPAWYDALGTDYGKATLAFLARYADPNAVIRLGQARLARFLRRHSRGHWREGKAAELAADIDVEAEQAQALTEQMLTWTSGSRTCTPRPIPLASCVRPLG